MAHNPSVLEHASERGDKFASYYVGITLTTRNPVISALAGGVEPISKQNNALRHMVNKDQFVPPLVASATSTQLEAHYKMMVPGK